MTERHRKKEIELIQLLSRPLSQWIKKEERSSTTTSVPLLPPEEPPGQQAPIEPVPHDLFSPIPLRNTKNSILRQELNNVKLLCAQVVKGHKKLSKEVKECQEQLEQQNIRKPTDDESMLLQELNKQQQIHFRRQLIALDMKERAFMARVKLAEEECRKQCSEQLSKWQLTMDDWKIQNDKQWKEWEKKQEQAMKVNSRFRQTICRWMDMQYHDHDDSPKDRDYVKEHDVDDDVTPILFATNLGEVREYVPLYCSASSSSTSEG